MKKMLDAIMDSDARALCGMFWDSADVWSKGDQRQRSIVMNASQATVEDAAAWLEQSDAWRSVAGKKNISPAEFDAVVESTINACWWAMVESSLDRLRDESRSIESDILELEGLMYFGHYGRQNTW